MRDALRDAIEDISQGHQGALNVIFELARYKGDLIVFAFDRLQKQNIRGADIHYLYICCDCNIEKLHRVIMKETGAEMLKSVPRSSFYVGAKILEE